MRIERVKSSDNLKLFLYCPIPGYALVCFDNHPTKTSPLALSNVSEDLGSPKQTDAKDWQFLLAHKDNIDHEPYNIVSYPTYIMFRCGSDYKELGRLTEISRDEDHTKPLRSFALNCKDDSKDDTLVRKLLAEAVYKKVQNTFLKYMNKKYNVNLKMNDKGECYVKVGEYDTAIMVGKQGSVKAVCYAGKHKHDNDPDLLRQVMEWNFHENFLCGMKIGIQKSSSRFIVEDTLHVLEEKRWNEVTFENFTGNFSNAAGEVDKRIQEYKKQKKEKEDEEESKKQSKKNPSIEDIRKNRLSKYAPGEVEGDDAKDLLLVVAKNKRNNKGCCETWRCECCRRNFKSQNQLKNHIMSRKHKIKWKQFQDMFRRQSELEDLMRGCGRNSSTESSTVDNKHRIKTAKKKSKGAKEQDQRKRHKEILLDLVSQDKKERKTNGGKLKSKLGPDGYKPTGTFYEV